MLGKWYQADVPNVIIRAIFEYFDWNVEVDDNAENVYVKWEYWSTM